MSYTTQVSVAQWIEHWPPEPGARGSIPFRYISKKGSGVYRHCLFCVLNPAGGCSPDASQGRSRTDFPLIILHCFILTVLQSIYNSLKNFNPGIIFGIALNNHPRCIGSGSADDHLIDSFLHTAADFSRFRQSSSVIFHCFSGFSIRSLKSALLFGPYQYASRTL